MHKKIKFDYTDIAIYDSMNVQSPDLLQTY